MTIGSFWRIVILVVSVGCKEQDPALRAKELEVELAKAKAAQAQAEAEKARAEAAGGISDYAGIAEVEEAERAKRAALAAAQKAVEDADEAKAAFDAVMKEVDALNTRVDHAVTAVAEARNETDGAAAKQRLQLLQKEQSELKQRAAAVRAAYEKARRLKGEKISKECMENPLAEGCD